MDDDDNRREGGRREDKDRDRGSGNPDDGALALAGFSILESLLLSLVEGKILDKQEAAGLLADAAEAHRMRARSSPNPELHVKVADLIEFLKNGGNTTLPPDWLR